MDLLNNLAVGFATALSLQNLLYCFLGVTLGTLIGVLPGLGPVATLAMLLPSTYTHRSDFSIDYACRYLLRLSVRRIHNRDFG